MTDTKDGSHEVPSDDRKLSIPNSVQRRKFGSLGTYSRVVVCAVDPSGHAKAAFLCMCGGPTLLKLHCAVYRYVVSVYYLVRNNGIGDKGDWFGNVDKLIDYSCLRQYNV